MEPLRRSSGLLAAAVLVPAAIIAPLAASIADRYRPGVALVAGHPLGRYLRFGKDRQRTADRRR